MNALASAGLGNDSPAEAYVIGYTQGHNDALALAIRIEQSISATPLTHDETERLALTLWEHNGERPTVYELSLIHISPVLIIRFRFWRCLPMYAARSLCFSPLRLSIILMLPMATAW